MKVNKQIVVDTSQERAFRVFTAGIDRWWPREHHIGASPMKKAVIEPRVGGRWYSLCEDGSEVDTGKVLTWDPPARVVLSWQITAEWKFDPSFSTELEVRFVPEGAKRTRVELEHRHLERFGAASEEMVKTFGAPTGWNAHLERLARTAVQKAVVLYETNPAHMAKIPELFPAHKARCDQFVERGELLATGPFADPRDGSMAVFATRESAEEFVAGDPFVTGGVVAKTTIRDWNESRWKT